VICGCDCGASRYKFNLSHAILARIALANSFLAAKVDARIGTKLLKNIALHGYVRTWISKGLTWLTYLIGILVALSILGVNMNSIVIGPGLFTLTWCCNVSLFWYPNIFSGRNNKS
jgi:small-conductance mechanosensitive channel